MENKGFTVIELIVVIVIISILTLLAAPIFSGNVNKAKEIQMKHNIRVIEQRIKEDLINNLEDYKDNKVNSESFNDLVKNNKIYSFKGVMDAEENKENDFQLWRISTDFIRNSGIKYEGTFFYDELYNVYYILPEISLEGGNIKSATVLPYYLWDFDMVMENVDQFGLNTINIPIRVITSDITGADMKINVSDLTHSIDLAKKLQDKGINIILEPFIWIADGSIGETELNPDNVDLWFWKWQTDIIMPILQEFKENQIDIKYITVASNFVNLEYAHGYWSNLFKNIKENYEVGVMYRINWWVTADWDEETKKEYNKKINNTLLQDENLDLISIASYFELTHEETPDLSTVKESFKGTTVHSRNQNVYQEIKDISKSNGKKIFFGELGTHNTIGYAKEPWNNYYSSTEFKDAHYNYYRAYTEIFWDEDWFEGFSMFAIGDPNSSYTITDRKAINYIKAIR